MEITDPSPPPPPPPPAAYPRWILLDEFFQIPATETVAPPATYPGDEPDTKTVAHARTSKGRQIDVSLVFAAAPAVSRLCLHSPSMRIQQHGVKGRSRCHAIAAHGDSVLIEIEIRSGGSFSDDVETSDYFIYCAGDAAVDPSRPPSLSLLPPFYRTDQEEGRPKEKHYLDEHGTALLRRGQDDVLVAALDPWVKEGDDLLEAELCQFRSDKWEWELKRLPIIHDEGKRQEVSLWHTDRVIPIGDRLLLWVDYLRGIIFSDLWEESHDLRYVSLPVEPDLHTSFVDRVSVSHRSVCATDGGAAVRFVDVCCRCCCGCPVATSCAVSGHAFTIAIWALKMEDMTTWDKISVVDCQELWSLPGYHGIVPRVKLEYPTVNLDDHDVLCFKVQKTIYQKGVDGDLGTWLIELDTRRMEVRSTCYYDPEFHFFSNFVATAVSQYFDTTSPSRRTPARAIEADLLEAPANKPLKFTFPRVASPQEMLATLQEIPDLVPEDMMTVYGVLASDESRFRFRSLLALPMDMRKDYCLLLGKLSCFDM